MFADLCPRNKLLSRKFIIIYHEAILILSQECDDGKDNGKDYSFCDANCKKCTPPGSKHTVTTCPCEACNPNPFYNKCHITTSCITTPSTADYCACRAGYRADGLSATDPKQFRLNFPGQGYRVFVAPGVSCDLLCDK